MTATGKQNVRPSPIIFTDLHTRVAKIEDFVSECATLGIFDVFHANVM